MKGNMIGRWAFLIGVVLAVVLGFMSAGAGLTSGWLMVLALIGLIIGLFNIADHEVQPFLMSGAVLIIAAAFGSTVMSTVPVLDGILNAMLAIFVPATIIVAIKNVFGFARR